MRTTVTCLLIAVAVVFALAKGREARQLRARISQLETSVQERERDPREKYPPPRLPGPRPRIEAETPKDEIGTGGRDLQDLSNQSALSQSQTFRPRRPRERQLTPTRRQKTNPE